MAFRRDARKTAIALDRELVPMPGIEALLTVLTTARCVASNGHLDRVRERLALTGLLRFFDPHVFRVPPSRSPAASPRPISF